MKIQNDRQLAIQLLQNHVNRFIQKWQKVAPTFADVMQKVPDCWERDFWICELNYKTGGISKEQYLEDRNIALEPRIEHTRGTIKEWYCWRRWRERYPILLEKAQQGNKGAQQKLDIAFSEKSVVKLKRIAPWNEQVESWLLDHRDYVSKWTLAEVIDQMEKSGVKLGTEAIPEDTRKTGKLRRGEMYEGHNRDKFKDKVRKLLNEMKIKTKGSPRDH